MANAEDILSEAKEAFTLASDHEDDNRTLAHDDLEFARLGKQWPEAVVEGRGKERPALTINKMPSFIRQVVNDARQNKPQIKVRPVDSGADVKTANIISGLIRSIERQSNADVAYDTAGEYAVTMGWGYFRVDVDYSHDDTFDQDIRIERVANPFSVYGDPFSNAADSADWNTAFQVEMLDREVFKKRYKGAEAVDWDSTGYTALAGEWYDGEEIMLAEYWTRSEVDKPIYRLSDGRILDQDSLEAMQEYLPILGVEVVGERTVKSHKVTHHLMTGAEVLETTEWRGRYIPLVPVYGEELNVDGKRYFRSLIRDAKDAQRMFNYWRSASTELVALAPKSPFIGPEVAFTGKDSQKWGDANIKNHAFLAYKGTEAPQRQPFAGPPQGALQEALNANDDMKAVMGLFDASLGARSNETSGRAIMARQREGDVSTFHFLDNLSRAIRHGGRIVLDLIPHVYTGPRIIRTLGEDDTSQDVMLAPGQQQAQQQAPQALPEGIAGVFDLTAGKYDLAVEAGPSFTTRRQEAAEQMMELVRVFPAAAPVIGDLLVKNLDWPGADKIAERLQGMMQQSQGVDPREMQKIQQQVQKLTEDNQKLEAKLRDVMGDKQVDQFKAAAEMVKAEADAEVKRYDAETKRMDAHTKAFAAKTAAENPQGPYDKYEGGRAA